MRMALGAKPFDLARMVILESSVLGLLGCAAGILLAVYSLGLFRVLGFFNMFSGAGDALNQSSINWLVLVFSMVVAVVTVVAASVAPVLQVTKKSASDSISCMQIRQASGLNRAPAQKILVVGQIAVATVLLVCAGLISKSFRNVLNEHLGFNEQNVLTTWISLPEERYKTSAQQSAFFAQLLDRIAVLPGVQAVGVANYPPFFGEGPHACFAVGGQPDQSSQCRRASFRVVSGGYFETIRNPLRSGREFSRQDTLGKQLVFIVNETLAKQYFPGRTPLGAGLTVGGRPGDFLPLTHGRIVGVVEDSRISATQDAPVPQIFMPFLQSPTPWENLWVRTTSNPLSVFPEVERQAWAIDKDQPVFLPPNSPTFANLALNQQAFQRLFAGLFIIFAGLGLFMAAIGTYAMSHFTVAQRRREFSIRLALGAQRTGIWRLAMGFGLRLALLGSLIGAFAAFFIARLTQNLLYHVRPDDPWIILAAVGFLTCTCLIACFVPASRTTRVNPIDVLRSE